MAQYYVLEIQQYANGEFGHLVHYAYDADANKARLKGESKYHAVISAAALSELPSHAAILIASNGFPIEYKCYAHETQEEVTGNE